MPRKHFPCHWLFVRGIHRCPPDTDGFPSQRAGNKDSVVFLMCVSRNSSINRRVAGDSGRHDPHCDVIVCVNELGHHWFRRWLVACSVPSHYLNQCWLIVKWTPGNILQSNLNFIIFIQENAIENVVGQNEVQFVQGEMSYTCEESRFTKSTFFILYLPTAYPSYPKSELMIH